MGFANNVQIIDYEWVFVLNIDYCISECLYVIYC